jgi:hypothetical protein
MMGLGGIGGSGSSNNIQSSLYGYNLQQQQYNPSTALGDFNSSSSNSYLFPPSAAELYQQQGRAASPVPVPTSTSTSTTLAGIGGGGGGGGSFEWTPQSQSILNKTYSASHLHASPSPAFGDRDRDNGAASAAPAGGTGILAIPNRDRDRDRDSSMHLLASTPPDCPVLLRLCDDTYVPTQPWPVDAARDPSYCAAVVAQLQHFGGWTSVSKLRGFLRNRISAVDNIKSVPLKAMLTAYPHLFSLESNFVYLNPPNPSSLTAATDTIPGSHFS